MKEFRLYEKGKVVGSIEVTKTGVTIFDNDDLVDQLDIISRSFKRAEFMKRHGGTTFFLMISTPIEKMVEVLIRIMNELEDLGYAVET